MEPVGGGGDRDHTSVIADATADVCEMKSTATIAHFLKPSRGEAACHPSQSHLPFFSSTPLFSSPFPCPIYPSSSGALTRNPAML